MLPPQEALPNYSRTQYVAQLNENRPYPYSHVLGEGVCPWIAICSPDPDLSDYYMGTLVSIPLH